MGVGANESGKMLDDLEPAWVRRPLFRHVHRVSGSRIGAGGPSGRHDDASRQSQERGFLNEFTRALSRDSAAEIVVAALASKLRASLTAQAGLGGEGDIDASRSVSSYGVDSLMAVTLRGWLKRMFQADVSTFEILGGGSLRTLGMVIANKSELRSLDSTVQPLLKPPGARSSTAINHSVSETQKI